VRHAADREGDFSFTWYRGGEAAVGIEPGGDEGRAGEARGELARDPTVVMMNPEGEKMKKSKLFLFAALLLGASLLVACGQAAAPTGNPAQATVAPVAATVAPVQATVAAVAATVAPVAANNSNPYGPDACSVLTKDDVSKVLGKPVDTATGSGMGGVCTYTSMNLTIDFTIAGHTGGTKAMATTLARLGDIALVVPGLGDQAFYNTNSANGLFVLKSDAEYLFDMSDVNYQPLDPAVVQATEKALAVQLLSKLH
jgi:hypothetical protein